jgi:amino acid adenylation domain-containing protein
MTSGRLQDLVSAQAAKTPEARALVFADETVTYAQLEERANRLGRLLKAEGCGKGDRVALFVPKGIPAVVAMLGSLKAGCVYVPIDLASPPARVQRIFDACDPTAVIVAPEGFRLLSDCIGDGPRPFGVISTRSPDEVGNPLHVNATFSDLGSFAADHLEAETSDVDLAHLLFTSGSTGTPKGVMITHHNVVTFVDWATRYFQTSAGDQVSGHPPLHFDLSTFDIFGSLSRGATLHLVPKQLNLLAPKLAQWMRDSRLTQWFSVPSILTYMAKFDVVGHDDFPDMQRLLWCGEVLPTPTLIYWMERLPHVSFTNLYGPTEATIASSYYRVPSVPADEREDIPLGSPCGGEALMVLDEDLSQVPAGDLGEICIRGVGLSPGYWRDAEKTAKAFVPDPEDPTRRIYRTGDLGRVDENGLFRYVGRKDSQIKSRGYRIELGEIEAALNSLGCLRESAVVGVETGGFEGTMICCAYVPDGSEELSPPTLRRQLSSLVPSYMLPARWHRYDRLPKNANGKIDRRKIRETFEGDASNNSDAPVHASTDAEVTR